MRDIALGVQVVDGEDNLAEFARLVTAAPMSEWAALGLYDEDVEGWGEAFEQVMTRTIADGGSIHFELSGLDIDDALRGNPSEWVGRYTTWELQQIVSRQDWFSATSFYLRRQLLEQDDLERLGIRPFGEEL